ncbi:uncharacterized protein LOC141892665 isoform X2 [Acropora palmata]
MKMKFFMVLLFLQLFLSAVFAENIRGKGKPDNDAAARLRMHRYQPPIRQRTVEEIVLRIEEMVEKIYEKNGFYIHQLLNRKP